MTENEKIIIKELIKKHGARKIMDFIRQENLNSKELESLVLEYLYTTNVDPNTGKFVNPCVSILGEKIQYFSNGISSIFQLNDRFIQKDWLTCERKIINKPIIYGHQKNLENKVKIENLVKDNCFDVSIIELNELVYQDKLFSVTELKLIKKLLENPKIHMSKKGLAIIAESDKGKAYILGKDKKGQRTF